ncbi:TetR/AcrR family transcriptional regulator [Sphingomonas sp. PB4P5]|uniref:TetR/AcrR family transcriptional regulator n=1 Tax=Parasphingomonas puruogangriensis TaxID=3096155 RepID=UPI002FCBDE74
MGRRSDHSRVELREIIVSEGQRQMADVGFARFSAREVAKRVGYSIGTIYNVFGSYDALMLAINGRTLDLWLDYLETRLDTAKPDDDRLGRAIDAYFEFAIGHRHAWAALYDFRLPDDTAAPDDYVAKVTAIMAIVEREVIAEMPAESRGDAASLTRSLLATVHGHCFFTLAGTFRMLGEVDPLAAARARVADALASHQRIRK